VSTGTGLARLCHATQEDFGIAPVEAPACGAPVIAFGKGGATESIQPLGTQAATGLFFSQQMLEAIMAVVERFEREDGAIRPQDCRANAERFSAERFRRVMGEFVQREWVEFRSNLPHV